MNVPPPGVFQGNHAVVIGASISGLLAARVLAAHFDWVTVLDRDALPRSVDNRRGVPQGNHGHGLLASGFHGLKRLFPTLERELLEGGAVPGDVIGNIRWFQHGHYKARFASGLHGLLLSRPLLETSIRRQVQRLPNVRIVDHSHVLSLLADKGRVTGILVQRAGHDLTEVRSDLLVDASGRGSRSPEWLEDLGYSMPAVEEVKVDIAYTTRTFRRRPGDLGGDLAVILAPKPPDERRVGFMLAMEGGRWMVSMGGWLGTSAPTDAQGFVEFSRTLVRPDIYDTIKDAEPLTDGVKFRFPSNRRFRYDRLKRFPGNYLVIGDALCSFNPLYGQGMSVATLEALTLNECLSTMPSPERVWRPFFKAAARAIDTPWMIAAGSDFAFTGVTGPQPAGIGVVNWYLNHVHKAASVDRQVCRTFFDVANLLRPATTLFAPTVVARVARACMASAAPGRVEGALDSKGARLIETT